MGSCRHDRPPFRPGRIQGRWQRAAARGIDVAARSHEVRATARARSGKRIGGDWREAITFVRNMAPTIWQRLLGARSRALHASLASAVGCASSSSAAAADPAHRRSCAIRQRLHVHAGRLQRFAAREDASKSAGDLAARRPSARKLFDRVVNCTGPDYAVARSYRAVVAQSRAVRSVRARRARAWGCARGRVAL